MRLLLTIAILTLALHVNGQSWKKQFITSQGDTLRPGDKIKIVKSASYTYVFPAYNIKPTLLEKARRYLVISMPDNTYTIERLSRLKIDKQGYTHIGVIEVRDNALLWQNAVLYYVSIDDALANNEIEIVRP